MDTEALPGSIRRYEFPIAGAVAEHLFCRGWLPEHPRASVLLVHGFAEHSGRYEHVGRWLAERSYAVHAYDHVGHGRSTGTRCYVDGFSDYLDDLDVVLERVRGESKGLPISLIGHSMGGLVVASYCRERSPDLACAVLSGAALGLPEGSSRMRTRLARMIRAVAPRLKLAPGLDLDGLCSDPAVLKAYLADPLVESHMTAALAAELMAAVERIAGAGAELTLPILVLHGGDDTICPPEASERFAAEAPQARFRRYAGLRHEIFNEPTYQQVLEDVAAFLETHQKRGIPT